MLGIVLSKCWSYLSNSIVIILPIGAFEELNKMLFYKVVIVFYAKPHSG